MRKTTQKTPATTASRQMLLLEDSKVLSEKFGNLATEGGWTVHHARCLADAKNLVKKHGAEISLALVDLMIPQTKADLKQVDQLQSRRDETLDRINGGPDGRTPTPAELIVARAELEGIDKALMRLVDMEGGVTFLKEACTEDATKKWRVIILTARTINDALKKKLDIAVSGRLIYLREKPIRSGVLAELLGQMR